MEPLLVPNPTKESFLELPASASAFFNSNTMSLKSLAICTLSNMELELGIATVALVTTKPFRGPMKGRALMRLSTRVLVWEKGSYSGPLAIPI